MEALNLFCLGFGVHPSLNKKLLNVTFDFLDTEKSFFTNDLRLLFSLRRVRSIIEKKIIYGNPEILVMALWEIIEPFPVSTSQNESRG